MQPLIWSKSLVSSQWVTQHSTHTEGTTNYELRIHGMWHSQWRNVGRSAGQEVPHNLWSLYFQKRVPKAGQWTLLTARQISLTAHCSIYCTLFNIPRSQIYLSIHLFLHNFGRKLCMNSHISHMRYTLHPTYPFFITLTPTKHSKFVLILIRGGA